MYSLLLSANRDAWLGGPFEIELGRAVREHTEPELTARFGDLGPMQRAELYAFPALFGYEGVRDDQFLRLGWITRIQRMGTQVRLEYRMQEGVEPIPSRVLEDLRWDLEIRGWEENRTHWALKDVNLIQVLLDNGFLDEGFLRNQPAGSLLLRQQGGAPREEVPARPTLFRVPPEPQDDNLIAVMMPFSPAFNDVYQAIREAAEAENFRCERADDIWNEAELIQDIFSLIYRSRAVICDFSGRNANVFYEAGIAHTLGRVVVPMVQNIEDVPFDLRQYRHVVYLNNNEGRVGLVASLRQRLHGLRRQR